MIKINFDGIHELVKDLEQYEAKLPNKADEFCEALCELGEAEADANFGEAIYSGLNDVSVRTEKSDDGCSVIAEGTSVLFIEYGTGVNTAPHTIPKYERGTYEKGMGANPKGWVYRGFEGNNGYPLPNGKVYTKGDPANECMYKASEEMHDSATKVAREVFSK